MCCIGSVATTILGSVLVKTLQDPLKVCKTPIHYVVRAQRALRTGRTEGQTDGQTDGQGTDGPKNKQTDRQTDRGIDR